MTNIAEVTTADEHSNRLPDGSDFAYQYHYYDLLDCMIGADETKQSIANRAIHAAVAEWEREPDARNGDKIVVEVAPDSDDIEGFTHKIFVRDPNMEPNITLTYRRLIQPRIESANVTWLPHLDKSELPN